MKPKVSIIVPVYKAEKVLSRCIDSIINQTFEDWELILVDDGSPDISGMLCDSYAKTDNRIRVLHKSNEGVSSARNLGIDNSQGEYITFIDSDDYVSARYLQNLLDAPSSDLIICGFKNIGAFEFLPSADCFELLHCPQKVSELIDVPYYLDSPWGKLFKRDIIDSTNIRFDNGLRLGEDTLFCYEYFALCETVAVISDALYIYDGKWGGDSKYSLSYEELKNLSRKTILAINAISVRFGTNIDTRYKCVHLSKLDGLFSKFSDVDIYNLYVYAHKRISIYEFLGDNKLSPLTLGLITAYELAKTKKSLECCSFLKDLKKFITVPISQINFLTKKQKIFYNSMNIFGVNIIVKCLILIQKVLNESTTH